MSVQRGEVTINGEDVLDILKQRNNFRAVLEGAEYRNLDRIGNGDIKTARQLGELVAAMSKAALENCDVEGALAIEEAKLKFFAAMIEDAISDA